MTGMQVKQFLQRNGFRLNDVGRRLGESSQNFSAALKVQDIKTGMLERIARAVDMPIALFYGDGSAVANVTGDNNSTTVAGSSVTTGAADSRLLEMLAQKDAQLSKAQEQIDRLLAIIESTLSQQKK